MGICSCLEEVESPPQGWVTMTMRQQEGEMFAMQAHNPWCYTALVKYARALRRGLAGCHTARKTHHLQLGMWRELSASCKHLWGHLWLGTHLFLHLVVLITLCAGGTLWMCNSPDNSSPARYPKNPVVRVLSLKDGLSQHGNQMVKWCKKGSQLNKIIRALLLQNTCGTKLGSTLWMFAKNS